MESYFYFELEAYPTLLLKEGVPRPANNTSGLKTHLLKPLEGAAFVEDECMTDKSALLWSVRWSNNETLTLDRP